MAGAIRGVETIYRLTPMQEGMLFHTLSDPGLGLYVEQATCTLEGDLDPGRLRAAWERVIAHHPVLRTSFHWREVETPVQVVRREVELPWREEDLRELGAEEAEERFRERVAEEARRGFELERAPLLRMVLARTGDRRWRFLWTYHHLVLDGWSLPPLLGQVFDAYGALGRDESVELPPSRPYVDYVAWLESRDTPEEREREAELWRRELAGVEAATPLPGARRRGSSGASGSTARGSLRSAPATEKESLTLPEETTAALAELARRAGVTPGTVVQAAWALLLSRHLGFAGDQDDVVFGTVVSGRPPHLAGSGSMIGLFVNTLPVRLRVDEDMPLAGWLAQVQERLVALRDHEHSPLARIRRTLDREGDEPLFESLVAFENYPRDEGVWRRLPGLEIRDLESHERTHFPLVLAALPGDRLYFELAWAPEAFEPGVPERLLGRLEAVLVAMAEAGAAERPVARLPVLGPEETRRVLVDWSGAGVGPAAGEPDEPRTLHGLVAAQALRTPEAVAVHEIGGREVTYRELMARAAAVARALRPRLAEGSGAPEPRVAVLLERSAELYAAFLGVLGAGAAYLPLDPETPPARLREIVADAGARLAVTRRGLADALGGDVDTVAVDELAPVEGWPGALDALELDTPPERVAYVVYTSGSTGRPKGVMTVHRAVVDLVRSARTHFDLGPETRAVQLSSPAFDANVMEIWFPLAHGGRVCPVDRETLLSPTAFARAVTEAGADLLVATPLLLDALDPADLPTVRSVASGGDQTPSTVAAKWSAAARLTTDYGPTEGTVYSLIRQGPGGEAGPPLGRPIPGARLYVVDRRLRPVAPGAVGEVALGGGCLARGYLDRPALTAEKFVPDPFAGIEGSIAAPGARLYLSGDLGRLLPDGDVEFAGRIDHQVKIRGHRVEIGEIESVLRRHPAVEGAAVVARGRVPHRRLAAFVVLGEGGGVEEVRRWLAGRLPEPMVPPTFERLDALPETATGKLDRKALSERAEREPAAGRGSEVSTRGRPPAPGLESELARIWSAVLEVPEPSAEDDFFRLGGDSILAIRVIARAAEKGIGLSPRTLFEHPTVASLAAALAAAPEPGQAPEALRETRPEERPLMAELEAAGGGPVEEVYPLLPLQEGMLFESVRRPDEGIYGVQLTCRLEGDLDADAFREAWRAALARHPVLRTSFHWRGLEEPRQAVRREVPLPFFVEDWRGTGDADRRFGALVAADRRRGFELERAPLLRCWLVRVGEREHRFLWSHHHLVLDGWSTPLLLAEVFEGYRARAAGEPPPETPAPPPFRNAVERVLARDAEADAEFWHRELSGAQGTGDAGLPPPFPSTGEVGQGRAAAELSGGESAALAAFAREHGLTLATLAQGAWALALARWRPPGQGSGDPVIGVVVSTRPGDLPGVESMIGPLIDTVPLRVPIPRTPGVEWLRDLRRRLTAAEEHGPVSPVAVREWAGLPADQPLFASIAAVENFPVDPALEEGVAGVAVRDVRHLDREAVPLAFTAVPGRAPGEGLRLFVTFDRALYDAGSAERLLARAAAELRALAGLGDGAADSSEEAAGLAEDEPAEAAEAPSVPAAFRRRVTERPGAPAIVLDGGEPVAYGELGARVAALAAALRAAGAGPEVPVVALPSSFDEAVTAFLAVLSAGAVWVPLDARHPDDRLRKTALAAFQGAFPGAPRRLVLARPEAAARLGELAGATVVDPPAVEPSPIGTGAPPLPEPPAEAAAYLIFTSGSTGEPNPVAVSYGALAEHLAAVRRAYGLGPGERVIQVQSLAFDASVEQILAPLTSGACLFQPGASSPLQPPPPSSPHGEKGAPAPDPRTARGSYGATALGLGELLEFIRRHRLTVVNLPTALWSELAREVVGRRGSELPDLRLLLAGGEAMPPAAARRWLAGLTGPSRPRLVNAYGPTEAVVTATLGPVDGEGDLPADREGAGSVPVGRPLPGRRAVVLDASGRPAPLGAVGELCLGGVLARGYAGRPAATAEAFLPDSVSGEPGARLYRTGDRARWLGAGAEARLQVLGRLDDQVKVRGFRVEPAEVARALESLTGVSEAVVVARAGRTGTELAAFVTGSAGFGGLTDGEELRRALASRLPAHLVPATLAVVDRLPRTVTGKVDRRALLERLERPESEPATGAAGEAPRTPLEAEVAAVWREVLGADEVPRDARFTDLGGHSLLAMRVVSRLRDRLGVDLPLAALFDHPTVAGLARAVEEARDGGEREPAIPLVPRPAGGDVVAASSGQERLWFLDRFDPGSAAYNLPMAVRLAGALDAPALARALGALVTRHETLRTTFAEVGGRPMQRIAPAAGSGPALPVVDLSSLPPARRRGEAERWAAMESARPFDLQRGPLLRAALFRTGAEEHLLLLSLHHIVSDEVSLAVLVGELAALYRGDSLPPLPVQYADWALWQRRWIGSPAFERGLAWWREALAGAPETVALPADRPRTSQARAERPVEGGRVPVRLSTEVSARLRRLAAERGTTPFVVLLATVQAWLRRFGAGDDVVVGAPVANRTHAETEGLIGFFVNTVAVRSRAEGDPAFGDLLETVRRDALEALARQSVPFERVVEAVAPGRGPDALARSPLVQVMLAVHTTPLPEVDLGGLSLEPLALSGSGAKLDLLLELADGGAEAIEGGLEYAADLFDRATAERLAGAFERLAAGVAEDADRRLSALPLLSGAEQRRLTREWAGPVLPYDDPSPLVASFAARAAGAPDAVAVAMEGRQVTYGELRRRAAALAGRLRELGVGAESRVVLLAGRTVEMVVGVLGVHEAGAAYVPVDPRYPAERRDLVLADSGARVAVVDPAAGVAGSLPAGVVAVEVPAGPAATAAPGPPPAPDLDSLAYVIYTSGSTGRPKGVEVSHRAAARLLPAVADAMAALPEAPFAALGPDEVVSLTHSPAFDMSVFELWAALARGARLEVVAHWTVRDPAALAAVLAERRVTVLNQTPSAFRALTGAASPERLPDLGWIVFGGERLDPLALAGWAGPGGPRPLNLYGITETTVHTTFREMTAADLEAPWRSPVGPPLPDLSVHVVDAALWPVPAGVPGEIVVGGDGVARGYAGRPALTASRFVPDPFSDRPGARLYRSGDLARWLSGTDGRGDLEYLGRIDQQVKVRGFRIEPGEIEAALEALDGVARALVAFRDDLPGGGGLVAWVVPAPDPERGLETGAEPSEPALRAALAESLPEHMVPARLVVVDAFPLTPSGKVDRGALPAPGASMGAELVAPRSDLERRIAAVWEEVLGVSPVGVETGFFELGGHSLLATQAVARLREELGVEIPLRELFARPTVAALARGVEGRLGAAAGAGPIPRRADPEDRPLSPAQERLWFLDRFAGGSPTLVLSGALRLDGDLDRPALAGALSALARRHDPLRSVYPEGPDGGPYQRVLPERPFRLPVIDLSGLPAARRRQVAAGLAAEDAARPFRVGSHDEPLFRAALVDLGDPSHRLHLAVHHLVADGWALGVLVRELAALYRARLTGEPDGLPALPVEYADYARWLRDRVERGDLAPELEHWRRRLADAPARLELPTDRPRKAGRAKDGGRPGSRKGGRVTRELPAATSEGLRALARSADASPFMVLLAAFGLVLGRWAGQPEVVIGAPVAGRVRRELEGLVGLFLNHLALRLDLTGSPSFRSLLARARESALDAFDHQEVPFERVLDALVADGARPRDPSTTPVFQVYLNQLNLPGRPISGVDGLPSLDLPGLRLSPVDDDPADDGVPVHFDLELYVEEGGESEPYRFTLAFDGALFDRWRAEELLDQLAAVLDTAIRDPGAPALDLPLSTPRADRVLSDPAAGLPDTWPGPVHARLDRWAREVADRVAIAWEGGAVSYRRLAEAAGAVAARLAAAGIGRGDVVAIRARRSPALVPAVLGTLRAGAAFLLLDPAYPAARNAACLARARPAAWLRLDSASPGGEELHLDLESALEALPGLRLRLDLAGPDVPGPEGEWTGTAEVGPSDVAYVAFTSGSTGEPKGVVGLHRSLSHFLPWQEGAMALSGEDRFSLLSGLAHDPLHRDLFTPLWVGGAVVVPDGERIGEPGWLAGWAARERVTVAHLTPALGRVLTDFAETGGDGGPPLPDLRRALFVGDVLSGRAVARLRELAPSVAPINLYGATESQRAVGWWPVQDRVPDEPPDGGRDRDDALPLGHGMPGVRLLVLTPGGRRAGIGEVGEVFIASPHLAAGYLGDPRLTAERFLPDPADPGSRLYRTGDLGRYRGDGAVEALGRADRQVQVRGFRVEPAEIEAALERHPAVARAAVVPRDGRLVAYPVPAPSLSPAELDPRELRRHLAALLPEHMVPAAFVPLPELPLTPNRKLDRARLPPPGPSPEPAAETGERIGGDDPMTALVARVWGEVLELPPASVHPGSDFFDLGGHSLQVTRVLARVRDLVGVELPLRSLFEHATAGAFARHLEAVRWRAGDDGPPPLTAGDPPAPGAAEEAPASFGQERLWLVDRLEGSRAYHLGRSVALRGSLDPAALARALGRLAERHGALRTGLHLPNLRERSTLSLLQRVEPDARLPLPRVDLQGLPAGARAAEADRLAARLAEPPFDLARPPLARALLVRLAPDHHRFSLVIHHAATDGWSMGLLVRDLVALYAREAGEGGEAPPEPAVRYTDYAAWQRRWLRGETLEREIAWWRERLDPPPEPLSWTRVSPVDRPRPAPGAGSPRRAHRVPLTLPPATVRAVEALARREGATPFMVVLAAFHAALGRWSGSERPAVGTPVANRRDPRLEGVVGFFVNTLVLVGDLADAPTFRQLLARTRDEALGGFAHQDLPFERLVEALRPARERSRPPLFQAMLTLQTVPGSGLSGVSGLRVEVPDGPEEAAAALVDLSVVLVPEPGNREAGWSGSLSADSALFDRAGAERLAGELAGLLEAALAAPDRRVAELPLAPSAPGRSAAPREGERGPGPEAPRDPVPPRSALEREIAGVWEEVLESGPVGVTHDLFVHLGASSLLAVRLAARLEDRLGRAVPMALLFERPTVASLSAHLADSPEEDGPRVPTLLRLSRPPVGSAIRSARPPLVLVHPAGGSGLAYEALAAALPEREVWALQAPGLDGGEAPVEEVAALAARHLDALEAEPGPLSGPDRRSAPIHLGGWSFGALVAFEMARRLAARGGAPGLVVAIDAAPGLAGGGAPVDGGEGGEGSETALLVKALSEVAPVTAEELRGLDLDQRVDLLLSRARERGVLGPEGGAGGEPMERETARRLLAVFTAALRAAEGFRPEPADLAVALLAAAESDHLPADDPAAGWRRIARGGVEVAAVPGDHGSVVSPENAPAVARTLARLLDRADGALASTRPTTGAG